MKIVTANNGKKSLNITEKEWRSIGEKSGWVVTKTASKTASKEMTKTAGEVIPVGTFGVFVPNKGDATTMDKMNITQRLQLVLDVQGTKVVVAQPSDLTEVYEMIAEKLGDKIQQIYAGSKGPA